MSDEASSVGDAGSRRADASADEAKMGVSSESDAGQAITSLATGFAGGRAGVADAGTSGAGGHSAAGASGSPAGASDSDGPSDCGDGAVDGPELCDSAIDGDQPGACPTECSALQACHPRHLEGEACLAHCVDDEIVTRAIPDDGCCPEAANANLDNDCDPRCGNGELEQGETCDPLSSCPSQADCVAPNACLRPVLAGDRDACTAHCEFVEITACKAGDGCCPEGCVGKDSDCPSACGDGRIDTSSGETCEADSEMPCRDSCDDHDACTSDRKTGSADSCNVACVHEAITRAIAADGCCPARADATIDSDCLAKCGNGVREPGEVCDGDCPTSCPNQGCTTFHLEGTDCTLRCVAGGPVTSSSTSSSDGCCPDGANQTTDTDCEAVCGNGAREPGEACDDGNASDGDGCSRACELDDDERTTGDERTGYVLCGNPADGITCTSAQRCCYWFDGMDAPSPYTCSALSEACSFSACDGPEDCGTGEVCCFEAAGNVAGYTNDCRPASSCGGNHATIVCHRDGSGTCL